MTANVSISVSDPAVDFAGLASFLGVSKRHVHRLKAAGKLPEPIRLGRCVRWTLEAIRAWMDAGGPDRAKREAMNRAEGGAM